MALPGSVGLNEPRGLSRGWVITLAGASGVFAVVVLAVYLWGKTPLPALPILSTVHAVAMAVICTVTAALLLTHARASGERGYLILGGTFAYVAGIMVIFPAVYPNGLVVSDPPTVVWGTLQSSATLFHPWHLALIIGVTTAALVLGHDQRTGRPPGLGRWVPVTVVGAVVAVAMTTVVVVALIDLLPPVVEGVSATEVALSMFRLEALLALIGTVIVAYECRGGSIISRWLLAVMVVTLGEAVTMLNADRYSLAWYYNRVVGVVAALLLLGVLIRDLARIERVSRSLIDTDALTGAASRAAVLASIQRESRRAHRVGATVTVLWVDLDGFKEVNERLGNQVGDRILVDTRARIAERVGPQFLVGRVGGDEFAVVVPGTSRSAVEDLALSVLAALGDPFSVLDSTVVLTASIGLATTEGEDADPERTVRRATVAMQAAKGLGGSRYAWFSPDLGADAVARAHLRHALSEAIRDQAFTLAYQPIVDLTTGEVAGAEALVRWGGSGQGEEAARFIAFAEESGQIVAIGRSVVALLEQQAPQLLDAVPKPFVLTMNLSVKELADDGVVDSLVHGPLRQYCDRLVIEVTESFEMHGDRLVVANLERLLGLGYRTAVDDFGAGYSNFTRLAELRPDIVKIDRSIVVRAGSGSPEGLATMQATTDVARALHARVLAEGVESNDEAEAAIRMGIDLAQGYRYSRPTSLSALLVFCSNRAVGHASISPRSEGTRQA